MSDLVHNVRSQRMFTTYVAYDEGPLLHLPMQAPKDQDCLTESVVSIPS